MIGNPVRSGSKPHREVDWLKPVWNRFDSNRFKCRSNESGSIRIESGSKPDYLASVEGPIDKMHRINMYTYVHMNVHTCTTALVLERSLYSNARKQNQPTHTFSLSLSLPSPPPPPTSMLKVCNKEKIDTRSNTPSEHTHTHITS